MELGKIKGYGELLTAFRSKDKDGSGFIEANEDADVPKLDLDKDGKLSLWEVMAAANKKAGKKTFSDQAIKLAKESLPMTPNLSAASLARFILLIESSHASKREISKAYQALDKAVKKARSAEFPNDPFSKLDKLYRLITGVLGFGTIDEVGGTRTFASQLAAGKMDKRGMSWLLVTIGRELGWPVAPAAFSLYGYFVKWDGGPMNFETACSQGTVNVSQTYGNCYLPDEIHISALNLSRQSVHDRVYLAGLTEVEMLGTVYDNLATTTLSSGHCDDLACKDRVLQTADRALSYHKTDIAALMARAVAWFPGENEAIRQMNGAAGNANGWNRMINIKKEMDKIARLDPNNFDIDLYAAKVYAYGFIDCRGADAKLTQAHEKLNKVEGARPEGRKEVLEQIQDLRGYLASHKQDCKEHVPDAQEIKARAAWAAHK
jgi:hypothetical protein